MGVCFAGFLAGNAGIALLEAIILAVGIAIQNIPEGAIISMPLNAKEKNKKKAFKYGVLSGLVEPVAAAITIILINVAIFTNICSRSYDICGSGRANSRDA